MHAPPPHVFLALCFIGSGIMHQLMCRLALRPWQASDSLHWTERARLFHLFRKTAGQSLLASLAISFVLWLDYYESDASCSLLLWGVFASCITSAYWIARIHQPRMTLKSYVTQTFWTIGIFVALIVPVVWAIVSSSADLSATDLLRISAAFGVYFLILTGVWLLWLPGRDKHAETPRLQAIVAEACATAGIKPVRAWVIESFMANAIAMFYIRSVVVTSRAMEILHDDELRTIVRHEVAHLRESLPVRVLRFLGTLPVFGLVFIKPAWHRYHAVGLLMVSLGILISKRVIRTVARRMEERADKMSVVVDEDGPVYARALEKLYEANRVPAVLRGRQIHPNLYDRMIAAGVTPDYPRPRPPERFHWSSLVGFLPFIWLGARVGHLAFKHGL